MAAPKTKPKIPYGTKPLKTNVKVPPPPATELVKFANAVNTARLPR